MLSNPRGVIFEIYFPQLTALLQCDKTLNRETVEGEEVAFDTTYERVTDGEIVAGKADCEWAPEGDLNFHLLRVGKTERHFVKNSSI